MIIYEILKIIIFRFWNPYYFIEILKFRIVNGDLKSTNLIKVLKPWLSIGGEKPQLLLDISWNL